MNPLTTHKPFSRWGAPATGQARHATGHRAPGAKSLREQKEGKHDPRRPQKQTLNRSQARNRFGMAASRHPSFPLARVSPNRSVNKRRMHSRGAAHPPKPPATICAQARCALVRRCRPCARPARSAREWSGQHRAATNAVKEVHASRRPPAGGGAGSGTAPVPRRTSFARFTLRGARRPAVGRRPCRHERPWRRSCLAARTGRRWGGA